MPCAYLAPTLVTVAPSPHILLTTLPSMQVFLGASAVMSNGTVMGRTGNAAVAMMANAHSKPVGHARWV